MANLVFAHTNRYLNQRSKDNPRDPKQQIRKKYLEYHANLLFSSKGPSELIIWFVNVYIYILLQQPLFLVPLHCIFHFNKPVWFMYHAENIDWLIMASKQGLLCCAYMRQWYQSSLVQLMACLMFGAMLLSEPMLLCCSIASNTIMWNLNQNKTFFFIKLIWKYRLQNGGHFVPASIC